MKLRMANQCLQMGRLDQAEKLYQQILATEPENAAAITSLGAIYNSQEKHALAIRYLQKAIELQPDNFNARIKLANSLRDHGHLERAKEQYRHVLELQPGHAEVQTILALISTNTQYNEDIRSLEELYRRPGLPRRVRRRLAFALGKVFDDLKEYDKAFEYLAEGNRIAGEDHRPTIEAETRRYQRIRTVFDADFFRRFDSAGIDDNSPILITGIPRSGTSLVEQILASHPDVHGAGETEIFHRIVRKMNQAADAGFPDAFNALDRKLLQGMAAEYVAGLKNLANDERYITDKSIGNVMYIGLIGVVLPNARIVHCRRNPRDQGLSYFQHDFLHLQPNSYDLGHIGRYYRIHRLLMDHWERMLPGRMYPVQYEDIISDLETSTRGLLDHCGLPFDRACLNFHKTERTVNTASLAQVRRPLYSSSVGRWKNYAQQLQPLITALGMDSKD